MKIHYTTPTWHGGFGRFMTKAFESLGHEVCFFNDSGTQGQRLFQKIFTRIPKQQYRAEDLYRKSISSGWLDSIREYTPDIIVLEHAPNILAEVIREAKKITSAPVAYWMDSPPAGSQAKDVLAALAEADKIFSIDKKWMTALYVPESFMHLPLAGDPEIFYPIENAVKEYDVVFIGSFPPQSGDGYIRAKIIADIPKQYRVAAFGNGADYWVKNFPILKERVRSGSLLPAEKLNEIYNKTEIVLNIHSTWHTSSISARTYEIALSGAFQLVDWREDLDVLFPREIFAAFRYARDINGLIEHWMHESEEKRQRIAEKIREHALMHNTWRHRAQTLLNSFENH